MKEAGPPPADEINWKLLMQDYSSALNSRNLADIIKLSDKLSNVQVRAWYMTHNESIGNLGMTRAEALQGIIDTATKTNKRINESLGLEE